MKHFGLTESHRVALDAGFQPDAPGSTCLSPQNAPAATSFYPLKRSAFGISGVKLIRSGEQRTRFNFGWAAEHLHKGCAIRQDSHRIYPVMAKGEVWLQNGTG